MNELLDFLNKEIPEANDKIGKIRTKIDSEEFLESKKKFLNDVATVLLNLDIQLKKNLEEHKEFLKKLNQLQVGTILAFLAENITDCKKEIGEIVTIYDKKIESLEENLKEFE